MNSSKTDNNTEGQRYFMASKNSNYKGISGGSINNTSSKIKNRQSLKQ
jgi:hypothetical protein